jgi:two-component system chemotaxis response regulator CheY
MKILIVDDSKVMRMLVRRTLRQANIGEHEYEEAENGEDALRKLENYPADLILSDWNMPNMDGPAMLARIRELGNKKTRVGFITSQSSAEARETLRMAGAAFLVTKPFTAEDIEAALLPIIRG